MPGWPLPWFWSLVLTTSSGHVTIEDTIPAPAPAIECLTFSWCSLKKMSQHYGEGGWNIGGGPKSSYARLFHQLAERPIELAACLNQCNIKVERVKCRKRVQLGWGFFRLGRKTVEYWLSKNSRAVISLCQHHNVTTITLTKLACFPLVMHFHSL